MEEEWRPVKGYEGLYEVSSMGRVKSLYTSQGRILKQSTATNGYMLVNLSKNGTCNTKQVHRLVAIAFIRNSNNYSEVNHKDCNKKNNTVDNLKWCTRGYNVRHACRNGRINRDSQKKSVILYKKYGEYKSITEAAKALSVTQQALSRAIYRNRSVHGFTVVVKKTLT